jgi:hypothetical protein
MLTPPSRVEAAIAKNLPHRYFSSEIAIAGLTLSLVSLFVAWS